MPDFEVECGHCRGAKRCGCSYCTEGEELIDPMNPPQCRDCEGSGFLKVNDDKDD